MTADERIAALEKRVEELDKQNKFRHCCSAWQPSWRPLPASCCLDETGARPDSKSSTPSALNRAFAGRRPGLATTAEGVPFLSWK